MRPTTSSRPSSCSSPRSTTRSNSAGAEPDRRPHPQGRASRSRPPRSRRARLPGGPRRRPHQDAPLRRPRLVRRAGQPADQLTDRRRQDLPRLRDRDHRACQNQHDVTYTRMDELARKLVIARGDAIAHQRLLNELSDTDLLIIDDFLTIGIDLDAASDLFAILANREHRRPTVIVFPVRTRLLGHGPAQPGHCRLDRQPALEQRPHHLTSATSTCAGSVHTRPARPTPTGNSRKPRPGGSRHQPAATRSPDTRYQVPRPELPTGPICQCVVTRYVGSTGSRAHFAILVVRRPTRADIAGPADGRQCA